MSGDGNGPTVEDRARYDALKKELMQALPSKRAVDKHLAQIEFQIYNAEASYLTETAAHSGGNIIQGFEGYLKNQSVTRRRYEASDADRVFSNSSLTYQKSLDLIGDGEESATDDFVKQPTPGVTTVVVPPATRTQELSAAQQKKNRDREYQRKKRASASRRSTGTISEEEQPVTIGRRPNKRARIADDD